MSDNNSYQQGHRKRVKEKLIKNFNLNFELTDYEILEMILFYTIPRSNTKPLAKELLDNFHSLRRIIYAEPQELEPFKYITENTYAFFLLLRITYKSIIRADITPNNILSSWPQVLDYVMLSIANCKKEQLQVLYLDVQNKLIKDEVIIEGSIASISIHPKEIVRQALYYKASSIILVHNHPSGSLQPSKEDLLFTHSLISALSALDINLHDHIIVSNQGAMSFKNSNLM